jgi:hypothetical protein
MATLKEVMTVLGSLYRASEEATEGQLRSRVQNFQRLGIPIGLQLGKGKKISYARDEIYQLIYCMELSELGLMPSDVAYIVKTVWRERHATLFQHEWTGRNKQGDMLFIFAMASMSRTWQIGHYAFEKESGLLLRAESLDADIGKTLKYLLEKNSIRRFSIINISATVRKAEKLLTKILPPPEK